MIQGNVTIIRTSYGTHVDDVENTLTAGHRGPIVMHDSVFMDIVGSFDRERIPSRTVYASGTGDTGAFGKFTVTHDITRYTKAKLFDKVGKTTNVAVRFSRQMNDRGTAETTRDNFGMSVKFYTQDGIYDLLSCSSEVYFVRDAMKYPLLVHAFMRNPVTNIKELEKTVACRAFTLPQSERQFYLSCMLRPLF
ncbi:hypothetical protein ANN_17499 [Periplaneta americana]|uniref:Catalase core domain-containing protein n=1 Tax=Periplaneta americana TaxID=6978 RepID=A0ABQ8SU22_PERAM|nr:hypothetical protein ANN_17499 [Periplaneta americana]